MKLHNHSDLQIASCFPQGTLTLKGICDTVFILMLSNEFTTLFVFTKCLCI